MGNAGLYPTDLVEKQQAAQQAAASRAGQGIPKDVSPMIENDDDDDGMTPPGSVPRIPGPNPSYPGEIVGGSDAIILSSGEDAIMRADTGFDGLFIIRASFIV